MTEPPILVVGAGIVGLATALALASPPRSRRVLVLEKEAGPARHQTGHNSGVIHSGVYYRPGSLKARLTTEGRDRMLRFCDAHRIPYRLIGKVILASTERELPALAELKRRGEENGIPGLRLLDPVALREVEPEAAAVRALQVPGTGIVDYTKVCTAMVKDLEALGAEVRFRNPVGGVRPTGGGVEVETPEGPVSGGYLVNCAGLYSDRVAARCGAPLAARIVPFRGEYYLLERRSESLVRGLIYPVPDPEMPFLGVHLTRTIDGGVEAGPNAVLALAREGYDWRSVNVGELAATLAYPGFLRMARRYWRTGAYEVRRSLSKPVFLESLQKLVPALAEEDLAKGGSGIRAQAVGPDGRPLDDFVFGESPRAIHVVNAPSPAATASLSIGEFIATKADAVLS